MYCWGNDTSDWAKPSAYVYGGNKRARKAREDAAAKSAQRGGRKYLQRREPDYDLCSPRDSIRSTSENPVIVAVDVTGSMQRWPFEIFDRLPLLFQTLSQYRPDLEVSFVAIGDATCDRFPLQVTDFAAGLDLEDKLQSLYGEGGGGGGARESYELLAYYLLNKCALPNAARPFLILYGDEGYYDSVHPGQVRGLIGDELDQPLDSSRLWRAVGEAFNVFHLRKPYHSSMESQIHAQWSETLGEERVLMLDDEQRAVDFALGLIARGWGRFDDFQRNMSARQSRSKVRTLARALEAVEVRP